MDRFEAASKVQDHKDFFRVKWAEFCRWVEECGRQLSECQEEQAAKLKKLADELHALEKDADDASESKRREYEAEAHRVKQMQASLKANGWVRWAAYSLEISAWQATRLRLEPWQIFYAPSNLVNPINWVFRGWRGNPRPPDERERMLVRCARLVMAHDSAVDVKNCIHPFDGYEGKYKGEYFDCDAFCRDIRLPSERGPEKLATWEENGDLAKAWDDVRADLAKQIEEAPVEEPKREGGRNAERDQKTKTRLPREPTKVEIQAYKLYYTVARSQGHVAEMLTKEYRREPPYDQGTVSRMIARVRKWREANGLPAEETSTCGHQISVSPETIDMGRRTDGRVTGDPRHEHEDEDE